MKDRVREALFNLIGPRIFRKHAVDLFAGTGAVGLEALSRGAAFVTFVERHFPSAELIRKNADSLCVARRCSIITSDVFFWLSQAEDFVEPVAVFVCPPFALYEQRLVDMLELVRGLVRRAPPGSLLAVEADKRFDFAQLPDPSRWTVRSYPPAVLAVFEK